MTWAKTQLLQKQPLSKVFMWVHIQSMVRYEQIVDQKQDAKCIMSSGQFMKCKITKLSRNVYLPQEHAETS